MNINSKHWQEIEQIVQLCAKHHVESLEVTNSAYRICVQSPFSSTNTTPLHNDTVLPIINQETHSNPTKVLISKFIGRIQLAPDAVSPPCVQVGDGIKQGDTVAYVASLGKLEPIISEHTGTIKTICVENQQAIQYGQMLFELE